VIAGVEQARAAIERWYRAALAAVDPEAAVLAALERAPGGLRVDGQFVPVGGRIVVVAVGKAAAPMARAAAARCGDAIDRGVVLTKDGHVDGEVSPRFEIHEASHPIPDERGAAATRRILELVSDLGPDDLVLALISGGGSALLEAPRPPLALSDMAATTDLMLRAGAPIHHLNAVRTPLSLVKGGGLRATAPATRFVTLVLSDVLSNDPRVIASGPTIPAAPDATAALGLLESYGLLENVPAAVRQALADLAMEPVAAAEGEGDLIVFAGDNDRAVAAMAAAAEAEGARGRIAWQRQEGEAADLARDWVQLALDAAPEVDVIFGGGEATVTVRGEGAGGRNTEFALAAAMALADRGEFGWAIASLATDGQDALTGAAGAIADGETVRRAAAAGIDVEQALAKNDSLPVFKAAGGLVSPGPTGTNVNDIYVALRVATGEV
jgi:glycerate 2-kinase